MCSRTVTGYVSNGLQEHHLSVSQWGPQPSDRVQLPPPVERLADGWITLGLAFIPNYVYFQNTALCFSCSVFLSVSLSLSLFLSFFLLLSYCHPISLCVILSLSAFLLLSLSSSVSISPSLSVYPPFSYSILLYMTLPLKSEQVASEGGIPSPQNRQWGNLHL